VKLNAGLEDGNMKTQRKKLTPAMIAMLRSASAGLPLTAGLHGRSAHGGAEWTRMALMRRGLLDRNCAITADGYDELAEWSKAQSSNA